MTSVADPAAPLARAHYELHDNLWANAGSVFITGTQALLRLLLTQRARDAGARWVEILPTVIDIDRYPNERSRPLLLSPEIIRVVWIGSPCTVHYLSILQDTRVRNYTCHLD